MGRGFCRDDPSADDRPLLYLSVSERVSEDIGDIPLTLSLSSERDEAVTAIVTTVSDATQGDSAVAGQDFTPLEDVEVVIPPRTLSVTVFLRIEDDRVVEEDETFRLMVRGIEATAINDSVSSAAVVTIADDDTALASLTAATRKVSEGGEFRLSLGLTAEVGVEFRAVIEVIEETASSEDYEPFGVLALRPMGSAATASPTVDVFTLRTRQDDIVEADETLAVRIVSVETAVLDRIRVVNGSNGEPLRLTITNDDAALSLRLSEEDSERLCSMAQGSVTVVEGSTVFVVGCLTGQAESFTAELTITDDQGRILGLETEDYVLSGRRLSFDGLATRALVAWESRDDLIAESSEAYYFEITGVTGSGRIRIEGGRVPVIVRDDGDRVFVVLEGFEVRGLDGSMRSIGSGGSLGLGDVLSLRVRLEGGVLERGLEATVRIEAAEGDSGIASYTDLGGILTIGGGGSVSSLVEVLEMGSASRQTAFFVSLEGAMAGGVSVGIDRSRFVVFSAAPGTDPAVESIGIEIAGDREVREGEVLELMVRLTDPVSVSGMVDLRLEGWSLSAEAGVDFEALTQDFSLSASSPSNGIFLRPVADGIIEGDETLLVTVGGLTDATASAAILVTIKDTDVLGLSLTADVFEVREGDVLELRYELRGENLPFAFGVETEVVRGDLEDFRLIQGTGLLDSLGRHEGVRIEAIADGLIEGSEEIELGIGRITPLTAGFLDPLSALEVEGSVRVRIVDGDEAEVRLELEVGEVGGLGDVLRVIEGSRGVLSVYLFPGGELLRELEVRVFEGGMELGVFILGSGETRVSREVVLREDTMFSLGMSQVGFPGVSYGVGDIGVELVDAESVVNLGVDEVLVEEGGIVEIEVVVERVSEGVEYPRGEVVVRGLTAESGLDFVPLTVGDFEFDSMGVGLREVERFGVRVIDDEIREDEESFEVYVLVLSGGRVRVEGGEGEGILVRIEDDDEEEEEEVVLSMGGGGGIGPIFLVLGFLGVLYRLRLGFRVGMV